jgi:2-phospho-L-lactate/phosphoenolpyruvate guanylyltransferase
VHILIPCKNLDVGKSRLSECLGPAERHEFCKRLLTQTVERTVALAAPANIRVVTADPEAAAMARQYSVETLADPGGGLNAALKDARAAILETESVSALLVLPIDLPLATPGVISEFINCAGDIVIAPDEGGTGTNLLLLRSPALKAFRFAYGPNSFAAHAAWAQADGLRIEAVRDGRLAFDVDGPAQYATWQSLQGRAQGADSERPAAIRYCGARSRTN